MEEGYDLEWNRQKKEFYLNKRLGAVKNIRRDTINVQTRA